MDLKPGRELDGLVSHKVMGNAYSRYDGPIPNRASPLCVEGFDPLREVRQDGTIRNLPHYSTSIAAAWEVVRKLKSDGYAFHFYSPKSFEGYEASFEPPNINSARSSGNPAHAICLAALKAVGVEL